METTKTTSDWRAYWPLIALTSISALAALAITYAVQMDFMAWMHFFMGFFLCCFSMLKIFNIEGFANGFQKYDLLAKHSRLYAKIYPFIELTLGLGYLSMMFPQIIYSATVLVMGFGAIGVLYALKNGLNINCPCMGSILKVPLSTVTLTEDLAMGAMALWMLIAII